VNELDLAQQEVSKIIQMLEEGLALVEKSPFRDHLHDVAGHLIQGLPEAARRLQGLLRNVQGDSGRVAYQRQVEEQAGYQTLVRRNDSVSEGVSDQDRTKERALPHRRPVTPERTEDVPSFGLNVPPATSISDPGISSTRTRRRPMPGDQYGTPYKDDTIMVTRRTMEGMWRQAIRKVCREVFEE